MSGTDDRAIAYLRTAPRASYREIADALSLASTGSVADLVRRLERGGRLRRDACPTCGGPFWIVDDDGGPE